VLTQGPDTASCKRDAEGLQWRVRNTCKDKYREEMNVLMINDSRRSGELGACKEQLEFFVYLFVCLFCFERRIRRERRRKKKETRKKILGLAIFLSWW